MSSAQLSVSSRRKVRREPNQPRTIVRFTWAVSLGAAVSIFGAGCGAPRPAKYYQLGLPKQVRSSDVKDPLPVTLLIGRLKASHLYREDRIVYSTTGEEMGTYEFQRWAEPPTEMIEEMLLHELRTTARYAGVYSLSSQSQGDYLLQGGLFDLKEVSDGSLFARLTLDLELRDMKTGATVWTHFYTHDEPVNTKDIPAVVAALDRNAQRGVSEVRAGLDEYFVSHRAK